MSDADDHDRIQALDETGDPVAADDPDDPRNEPTGPRAGPNGREIVVPQRLYKVVTVFSTLAAVLAFLVGFTLIDAATLRVSFVRRTVVFLIGRVGVGAPEDVLTAGFAIAGVSSILLGTAVYVLGTRFRAQGMGKAQEDSSEG
jgi:hypothetical protein